MLVSKRVITAALVVAFLVALVAATLPELMRARVTPAVNSCVNNLRQLDGARQQWELEKHRTTNDPPPSMADLHAYLRQRLVCPQGGTYTLGRVGEPPKRSLGGAHTLPQ
jgi:hypothetical protein